MHKHFALIVSFAAILLLSVSACSSGGDVDGDAGPRIDSSIPDLPDADGDGIADEHEGRAQGVDTDGDGTPDYLDDDSDGDGIPDYREGGDNLSGTPPIDSDSDTIPDFQDTDSDNNGREDGVDGVDDLDGDGIGNFADLDDDGDGLLDSTEIGPSPQNPIDTDGDGTPDFHDLDSDADTILDAHELAVDPDLDNIPAYIDTDSDGDCIPDSFEAGDAVLATQPVDTDADNRADFLDLDSDNDGLADGAEDANCNGVADPGETSPTKEDSDNDGVSDLVEVAAGTDPNNAADNPQANGDFVFVVPYTEPATPDKDDLDFSTDLRIVDLYLLIDRSGSMTAEITAVRDNISTVLRNVTCAPLGTGVPGDCIEDVWSGVGGIGYTGSGADAYRNYLDLQPNPAAMGPALNVSEPGGCCSEVLAQSMWSVASGMGASAVPTCTGSGSYGNRTNCPAGRLGYPCFRPNALPVILFSTDETFTGGGTSNCPAISVAETAVNALGAKVIGIQGDGGGATLTNELRGIATNTGTVDATTTPPTPLVFNGADSAQTGAIETAIKRLANGIPLDISATPIDDASDSVDAVTDFVDHLETLQLGTPACANGLTDQDTNADTFPDLYLDVLPGTPVCWRLVPKMNTTVMPTAQPQLFKATIEVRGDGATLLDTRDVFFLVPPEIPNIPID